MNPSIPLPSAGTNTIASIQLYEMYIPFPTSNNAQCVMDSNPLIHQTSRRLEIGYRIVNFCQTHQIHYILLSPCNSNMSKWRRLVETHATTTPPLMKEEKNSTCVCLRSRIYKSHKLSRDRNQHTYASTRLDWETHRILPYYVICYLHHDEVCCLELEVSELGPFRWGLVIWATYLRFP